MYLKNFILEKGRWQGNITIMDNKLKPTQDYLETSLRCTWDISTYWSGVLDLYVGIQETYSIDNCRWAWLCPDPSLWPAPGIIQSSQSSPAESILDPHSEARGMVHVLLGPPACLNSKGLAQYSNLPGRLDDMGSSLLTRAYIFIHISAWCHMSNKDASGSNIYHIKMCIYFVHNYSSV